MPGFTLRNNGPEIVATDYWTTDHAQRGAVYLTANAGALRLLVPPRYEHNLPDMATAKLVVISRGPWPDGGAADAIEIMFDDHTDNPFALHIIPAQADYLPKPAEPGPYPFTVWTQGPDGHPRQAMSFPAAYYRRAVRLPCLAPWKGKC